MKRWEHSGGNVINTGQVNLVSTWTGGNVINTGQVNLVSTWTGGNVINTGQVNLVSTWTGGNVINTGQVVSTWTGGNVINTGQVVSTWTERSYMDLGCEWVIQKACIYWQASTSPRSNFTRKRENRTHFTLILIMNNDINFRYRKHDIFTDYYDK